MIAPSKLPKGTPGSFAGLLGQAGVAASSAAAGAAAGASAAASITAKRHSIAPAAQASDKGVVVRSTSGEISSLQEQNKPGSLVAGNLLEEGKIFNIHYLSLSDELSLSFNFHQKDK